MSLIQLTDQKSGFRNERLSIVLDAALRENMSIERYRHSMRVADTAVLYACRLGISPHDAWLAGIAHDFAREWTGQQLVRFVTAHDGAIRPEEKDKPVLLHGRVAAIILERTYGVTKPDVLEAVEHHTLGRVGMSPLAKLLFVADYLEPGRKFTDLSYRRSVRNLCLDCMVCSVIQHCANRHKDIHPLTIALLSESRELCDRGPGEGKKHE